MPVEVWMTSNDEFLVQRYISGKKFMKTQYG